MLRAFFSYSVGSVNYNIPSYSVMCVIADDGMSDMGEVIAVDFRSYSQSRSHGIERWIPTKLPGWAWSHLMITNIDVTSETIDILSQASFMGMIRIGDPDKSVNGPHTYDINYRIGPPLYNGLYALHLIGSNWSVLLHNVSFLITFPCAVDAPTLRICPAPSGTTEIAPGCGYSVADAIVSGHCDILSLFVIT
jgi:hypothetical protein